MKIHIRRSGKVSEVPLALKTTEIDSIITVPIMIHIIKQLNQYYRDNHLPYLKEPSILYILNQSQFLFHLSAQIQNNQLMIRYLIQ